MTTIDPPSTRRRRTAAMLAALIVLAAAPGCVGRDRPRRGWLGGSSPVEGTTIGRDLRLAPRGTVAPATSLGVDLVRESDARRSDGPPRRDDLAPVGYDHEERD